MTTPISKEAQDVIEQTVAAYPKRWVSGICAFTLINRNNGITSGDSKTSGPCHAGISRVRDEHIVVNAHRPTSQGQFPEFTKWVAREAPFSFGCLNRDNDDELLNHASVLDGELLGRGGVLWMCKAFRYCREDTFRPPFWMKLREAGCNGLQAFLGCSIVDSTGKPYRMATHNSLFGYASPTQLREAYDRIKSGTKLDNNDATGCPYNYAYGGNWGSMVGKPIKKPDGWGGFIVVDGPGDVKGYADALKEITEGDPKNVEG